MYAMIGKFTVHDGKRDALIEILLQAADVVAQLPGCRAYIVNKDIADETRVWVFEIWKDKKLHDASLKDEQVRSLITKAMPLMNGAPDGAELRIVGGHGLDSR